MPTGIYKRTKDHSRKIGLSIIKRYDYVEVVIV
jgi:hypothetical protein